MLTSSCKSDTAGARTVRREPRAATTRGHLMRGPERLMGASRPFMAVIVTLLLLLCAAPCALALEPPRPGELAQLKAQGKLDEALANAKAFGNYKVAPSLIQGALGRLQRAQLGLTAPVPPPAWRGMPTKGNVKVLALLIRFSDYAPTQTVADYQSMLFGGGNAANEPYESLHDYYARSSYNQLNIQGNVLGWYNTGLPRSNVTQTGAGREALIAQALNSYNASHDFSQYDNDGDGYIDYFMVVWTGPPGAWASFWWGYQTSWWYTASPSLDGKGLGTYSWQWEESTPLTPIHETGHALGLPDYYDYDDTVGPDGGVGGLDMMDGNWGDHNAFSKMLLDWLTPQVRSSGSGTVTLAPSAEHPDVIEVMPGASVGAPFSEYFMVQNRSRVGNDADIPTDGLLVWHVDARLDGTGNDYLYDNSYAAHKLLRLMEADGWEDIEAGWSADAGDFYVPGDSFGPATSPNSRNYAGSATNVAVSGISWSGDSLIFTAGIGSLAPVITITNPTGTGSYVAGSSLTVNWTSSVALASGEFGLWARSASGWYAAKLVAAGGGTSFTSDLTLDVPTGGGYQVVVAYRPTVGSGAWVSFATQTGSFAVTAANPTLTISAPTGSGSYAVGANLTVNWTSSPAPPSGEFAVWARSAAGAWYIGDLVPAGASTSYSHDLTLTVPAGSGYQAIVSWRPTVGSGAWGSFGTQTGSFAVTAP